MALHHRREPVGRTRFLLALTLSTVTAIGVAAPLAIQAVNADEPTFTAGDPNGGPANLSEDDLLSSDSELSLDVGDRSAIGGIGSRPPVKAQGQTSKTDGDAATEPDPESTEQQPALTNPDPEPTVEPPPEETTTTTTVPEETTTTTAPPETTTTTDPGDTTTTTEGESTTTTTDPETTTTSESTTTTAAGGPGDEGSTPSQP